MRRNKRIPLRWLIILFLLIHWRDLIYFAVLGGAFYYCSGCIYTEPMVQDEYITIYDKDWNTKYYGKIRKE